MEKVNLRKWNIAGNLMKIFQGESINVSASSLSFDFTNYKWKNKVKVDQKVMIFNFFFNNKSFNRSTQNI